MDDQQWARTNTAISINKLIDINYITNIDEGEDQGSIIVNKAFIKKNKRMFDEVMINYLLVSGITSLPNCFDSNYVLFFLNGNASSVTVYTDIESIKQHLYEYYLANSGRDNIVLK